MMDRVTAETILELNAPYDYAALRSAWRRLCAQYHPDRVAATGMDANVANDVLKDINIAFDTLKPLVADGGTVTPIKMEEQRRQEEERKKAEAEAAARKRDEEASKRRNEEAARQREEHTRERERNNEQLYEKVCKLISNDNVRSLNEAIRILSTSLKDREDSGYLIEQCRARLSELAEQRKVREKKAKVRSKVVMVLVWVGIIFSIAGPIFIIPFCSLEVAYSNGRNAAEALFSNGAYGDAYFAFVKLSEDSREPRHVDEAKERASASAAALVGRGFKDAKAGSYVGFGTYEQGITNSEKSEPIVWRILTVENGRALIVSEYGLATRMYHYNDVKAPSEGADWREWQAYREAMDNPPPISWDTSTLKTFLNGEFKTAAFAQPELDLIDGDVFCLSIEEANRFFKSDDDRKCYPTTRIAEKNKISMRSSADNWWLRNETGVKSAAFVSNSGSIVATGDKMPSSATEGHLVRPAIWVRIPNS